MNYKRALATLVLLTNAHRLRCSPRSAVFSCSAEPKLPDRADRDEGLRFFHRAAALPPRSTRIPQSLRAN